MYRLTKLIFIDSYTKGKTAAVNLVGNTNLNGDNGYGKTSMLRVLPLFFGAAPGRLVRRTGTNLSFVDYYLPRPTSYILFEYEREAEKNLVVIFRGDSSLRFRLIKTAYHDDLFFDDNNTRSNVIAASDWARFMKLRGYEPTQILSLDDYKNIIQSGLNYSETGDRKRKALINQYRMLYSFCQRGTSIQNIDLVATAILEREPSIEAIKEILTSILIQSSTTDTEEIPALVVKSAKLSEWMTDKAAYQAMSEAKPLIEELAGLQHDYIDCVNRQKGFRVRAKVAHESVSQAFQEADQQKAHDEQQLEKHHEQLSAAKKLHQDKKIILESTLNEAERKISILEKDRKSFDGGDIQAKQQQVAQIPLIQETLSQLKQRYQLLTEQQNDIESEFEKLKNDLKQSHQRKLLAFSEQERNLLETQQTKLSLLANDRQKQLAGAEENYLKELSVLQERLRKAELEQTQQEVRLKNTSVPLEKQEALAALRLKQQGLYQKTTTFDEGIHQAVSNQQTHENQIKALSQQAKALHRVKHELENKSDQLQRLKNPEQNNLLAFLRANHHDWSDNIAKVLPEALLLRTDLAPEITGSERSLYGVHLDLSVIESSRAANESLLQQQLLDLNDELGNTEKEIIELEQKFKQASAQSKSFEIALLDSESAKKKHLQSLRDLEEQLTFVEAEIQKTMAQDKAAREIKLKEYHKILAVEKARLTEHREAYSHIKAEINNRFTQQKMDLQHDLNEEKEAVRQRQQEAVRHYELELVQLDEQKHLALKENGVDTGLLQTVTVSQKEQEHALSQAKDSQPFVEDYRIWLKNEWSQYEILQTQCRNTRNELQQCIREWQRLEEDWATQEAGLQSSLKQAKKQFQQREADLNMLTRMLSQFPNKGEPADHIPVTADELVSISLLESQWRSVLEQDQAISKAGIQSYNEIKRRVGVFSGSPPQKFLERLTIDYLSQSSDYANEWLFAAEGLTDYMRRDHRADLNVLQETARLLGQQISDYYTALARTHKEINQLGRKVSFYSQQVIADFSTIDNLTVTVTSTLDKLEFWGALDKFSQSYQAWMSRSPDDLPDDNYIDHLKSVSQLFEKSGFSIKLSKSFDTQFSIDDQGIKKTARTTKELEYISSNGLSYLIIISIYTALVNMLRGNSQSVMIWPVDELRNFSANNTAKLMKSLEQQQISIFSAFPDPDPELLKHYNNRYLIEAGRRLVEYPDDIPRHAGHIEALLASAGV